MSTPVSRPILFSGAMVRALLAGTKTQTRRALKCQPLDIIPMPEQPNRQWVTLEQKDPEPMGKVVRCRFGKPGDELWVRETWAHVPIREADGGQGDKIGPIYRADGDEAFECLPDEWDFMGPWRPSIHMPRALSRITLRITDIRVERLQDISEADAMAEGIVKVRTRWEADSIVATPYGAVDAYKSVWNYVNGRDAWDANPWVWVLVFALVKP